MKTLVTTRFGKPSESLLGEWPIPKAKTGYSVIRMHAATINQLSNFIRSDEFPGTKAPLVLGNEGAGTIVESAKFAPGTRVGIFGGNRLGIVENGLFQEYVLVEDKRLFTLPEGLSWEQGATLSVNYITAYRALTRTAKVAAGQTVLISGAAGSVGLALMQVAAALGARPIGLVSSEVKAQKLRAMGFADVVDLSTTADVAATVKAMTGGAGVDIAMDPVCGSIFDDLVKALKSGGIVVLLGFTGGKNPPIDALDIIVSEKSIAGYSLHSESDEDVTATLATLIDLANQQKIFPIIDSMYQLTNVEEGYQRLTSRQAVGSIVLQL